MANSVLKGCGVTHIALNASDFDRSLKFYTEGLGFSVYRHWAAPTREIALLDSGDGTCIELFSNAPASGKPDNNTAGSWAHLAFHVADADACYRRALEAGAQPKTAPKTMELPSTPPIPVRLAFVFGPDGEELEFFQVLE